MKVFSSLLFSFLCLSVCAQTNHFCGDVLIKHQLENKYPGINKVVDQTFEEAKTRSTSRADVLRIPVVFHVVYNNDDQNLSDAILKNQIDILNEDFRRLNSNANETRAIFLSQAADAEIEFFLAGEDPAGNPTNGITRTFTSLASFINISITDLLEALGECGSDFADPDVAACIDEFFAGSEALDLDAMKSDATGGKDAWDTNRYLNIWIANLGLEGLAGGDPIPFVLGFAYPPMEAPNWPEDIFPEDLENKDGVVLHFQAVGKDNPFAGVLAGTNDAGRTCVHEVGHYLGLRHIWGDGDCTVDDGISDTPTAESDSQPTIDIGGCGDLHSKDSCMEDGLPDMIENYMDYSLESCQNMFTNGQVNIMRSMLEGPRSGLLENQISSIQEATLEYSIFPNPTSGNINIISTDKIDLVKIYNASGQLLLSTKELNIDIQASKSGIYFIEIIGKQSRSFQKIIYSN